MRNPANINGGVNNLKITSAVRDVINWQIFQITEQHQFRVSTISFNQMLLTLITAKLLHGWAFILRVVTDSLTAVFEIKILPSLSV